MAIVGNKTRVVLTSAALGIVSTAMTVATCPPTDPLRLACIVSVRTAHFAVVMFTSFYVCMFHRRHDLAFLVFVHVIACPERVLAWLFLMDPGYVGVRTVLRDMCGDVCTGALLDVNVCLASVNIWIVLKRNVNRWIRTADVVLLATLWICNQ